MITKRKRMVDIVESDIVFIYALSPLKRDSVYFVYHL